MSDHSNLMSEFSEITSTDSNNAKFFLESSGWNLEVALASFFENVGGPGNDHEPSVASGLTNRSSSSDDDYDEGAGIVTEITRKKASPRKSTRERSHARLATMAELRNDNSSPEDNDREAFYAGGSEHSGQQVLGPESEEAAQRRKDLISQMIKAAHEHGENPEEAVSHKTSQTSVFTGVGYRLGQTTDDSTMVFGGVGNSDLSQSAEVITLKLWREGFSIDDGPLREYSDPGNVEFLNRIRRGRIPDELLADAHGGTVHCNMEDHRNEKFVPSKKKVKAFSGKGHLLGSPAPALVAMDIENEVSKEENVAGPSVNEDEVVIDNAVPTTVVQVRLADGSRLHATLNLTHTIADLRKFIITSRPQYRSATFKLLTTYPSKELTDDNLTLAQAGILNSSILQRLV